MRFSIVVPVYKVQAYLHECLESVLTQSFTDFELLAVDDCSPDACGDIVDEFAARDGRVRAVHLPENTGLGPARNAGLERATGEYVLFLDSDDTMLPGSLQAICDRLEATGSPDILVFDYARTYWNGRTARNERAELVAEDSPEVFTLHERPALLMLLSVVWNKAYRRDFVTARGLAFPPGVYEDVAWTYPALVAAERIACLDRVCVHYRQRRRGNILGTRSLSHFDVFDQYDRVFAHLDAQPGAASSKALVFGRMVDHFCTILNKPERVPPSARARFFRSGSRHYRRHQPGDYSPPKGVPGLRHLLIRLRARPLYQALWHARATPPRLRERLLAPSRRLASAVLHLHYRLQRLRPVDPRLAVFGAYWNGGYACSPAAIEAKVRELAPGVRTAWVTGAEHAHTLPGAVERLDPRSLRFWTVMARAKFFVNNVHFPHRMGKRPGTVHVQTHHGTPLKHMGVHLLNHPAAAEGMDFERLLERCDRWDFSLSANRHSTLTWERAYPSGHRALEYGCPRNDVLHAATAEDVHAIRARLGIPEDRTAILYAPTRREYLRDFRPRFDLEGFARALGPGHVLMVRAHYSYADRPGLRELHERGALMDVSAHPSVEELCLAADALVTDYSSIMFDYANLDRPIVVHADDWEVYRAVRGVYFDIRTEGPGVVTSTDEELIEAFTSGEWCGTRATDMRAAFRKRFCAFDDGRAAERVVRHVFLGTPDAVPAVVPLDERSPAPAAGTVRASAPLAGA
ncbi:glycosyl transferase [Wenjunlia tyrosinilytica]|uniref:Glycosyl transferase n=1 Tax=Wenjunlia tyrosinilytica TaxID=1544741 RepID=A0A917ZVF0_9ACTN|nr:bifunctional glycosyltransferase family 2 protein/CDP-glycerol:glycerophosphate glycerophosphotransferase [Wenjunlia tyrosinilytica]GGO97409.1 glycosyl transferase [Wenjunlia tyrosinilytica]